EADPCGQRDIAKGLRPVVTAVVGKQRLHGYTESREGAQRACKEASGGRASLVRQGLDVGVAAVSVDSDMEVVMARTLRAGTANAGTREVWFHALSTAHGDTSQALHIEMDEFAWCGLCHPD